MRKIRERLFRPYNISIYGINWDENSDKIASMIECDDESEYFDDLIDKGYTKEDFNTKPIKVSNEKEILDIFKKLETIAFEYNCIYDCNSRKDIQHIIYKKYMQEFNSLKDLLYCYKHNITEAMYKLCYIPKEEYDTLYEIRKDDSFFFVLYKDKGDKVCYIRDIK